MTAQLPDQTKFTGFIPKDLYNSFLSAKGSYDRLGRTYPYFYYQYYGIPYKVWYGDPFTLIDYVDTATAVYDPTVGIPGISPDVEIVVGDITPPSPDMIIPGFGIPAVTSPGYTAPIPTSQAPAPVGSGSGSGSGSVAGWALAGIIASTLIFKPRSGKKRRTTRSK